MYLSLSLYIYIYIFDGKVASVQKPLLYSAHAYSARVSGQVNIAGGEMAGRTSAVLTAPLAEDFADRPLPLHPY